MNSSMEKPYVVGIDIGGTNTVFGIVDARGTIIAYLLCLILLALMEISVK